MPWGSEQCWCPRKDDHIDILKTEMWINSICRKCSLLFQKFASEGLRTLVLGVKDLSAQQFEDWKASHHEAAIALDNREEKLDAIYNEIEKDLKVLGATAIEDKLQVSQASLIIEPKLPAIIIIGIFLERELGFLCILVRD